MFTGRYYFTFQGWSPMTLQYIRKIVAENVCCARSTYFICLVWSFSTQLLSEVYTLKKEVDAIDLNLTVEYVVTTTHDPGIYFTYVTDMQYFIRLSNIPNDQKLLFEN